MPHDPRFAVVQVPGSTSNIGPGFDCLGIALRIYNQVRIERRQPTEKHPTMVAEAAKCFFAAVNRDSFSFAWSITGDVPRSRGLGSSVTLRQGVLQGLNELCGRPLCRDDLFRLGAELEGHPDNASAGVFGGFTCSNANGALLQFPISESLQFVLLIPDREVLTEEARACLPNELPRREIVPSLGHACVITAAFASQRYELLRDCFVDALHQPYRAKLNPGLYEVIAAGEAAGALGGFLSGSGSTIACVTLSNGEEVATAMRAAYTAGPAETRVVLADNEGARTREIG